MSTVTVHESHPNWRADDCGLCCAGIAWGGETPDECRTCGGGGVVWVHRSGIVAQWPGGPFTGDRRPKVWN